MIGISSWVVGGAVASVISASTTEHSRLSWEGRATPRFLAGVLALGGLFFCFVVLGGGKTGEVGRGEGSGESREGEGSSSLRESRCRFSAIVRLCGGEVSGERSLEVNLVKSSLETASLLPDLVNRLSDTESRFDVCLPL